MDLINQVKKDQLQARKDRNTVLASSLTTFLGEATNVGKSDGNRETTDAEVVAIAKKFIKGLDETAKLRGEPTENEIQEKIALTKYLPQQMTGEQLVDFFTQQLESFPEMNMGQLMEALKTAHPVQYDGKQASQVLRELL